MVQVVVDNVRDGRGLPASAYADETVLQAENGTVFTHSWVCAGVVDDVPKPGNVMAVSIGGKSLLLVRARDGNVRVFHNFCRHRGMRLAEDGRHHVNRLVCPYHCWTYDLTGKLVATPHFGGPDAHEPQDIDVALPEGLKPVRFQIWNRFVFVNLSGEAEPFEAHIAPLADRWKDYDLSLLRFAASATYEVACNWKLAIENFIDVYHVPYVHPGLNSYNSMHDHYFVHEETLFGEGNPNVVPTDSAAGQLPVFPNLPKERETTLEALCLFPNLLITATPDYIRYIIVDPLSAGRSRERAGIFVVGDEAMAPELEPHRAELVRRFEAFNDEDIDICQRLQGSMQASDFDAVHFSPVFDEAVRKFQLRYAKVLDSNNA